MIQYVVARLATHARPRSRPRYSAFQPARLRPSSVLHCASQATAYKDALTCLHPPSPKHQVQHPPERTDNRDPLRLLMMPYEVHRTLVSAPAHYDTDNLPPGTTAHSPDDGLPWSVVGDGTMAPLGHPDGNAIRVDVREFFSKLQPECSVSVPLCVKYIRAEGLPGWRRMSPLGPEAGLGRLNVFVLNHQGFLEIQQTGTAAFGADLPEVYFNMPVSSVQSGGQFADAYQPAFDGVDVKAGRKMTMNIEPLLVGADATSYKGNQFYIRRNSRHATPITRGELAKQAAKSVIAMLKQESTRGSPLCYNNAEIIADDLLLISVQQVSRGSFRPRIAMR